MILPRPAKVNDQESEDRDEEMGEPMSPDSVVSGGEVEGRSKSQGPAEKLEMLRKMRADIDADIQTLERTMEILGST